MKRVGIVSRLDSNEILEKTREIISILEKRRFHLILERNLAEKIGWRGESCNLESFNVDFLIVIGGDGTVLRTARLLGKSNIPMLVINAGTLGFLSEIEIHEINSALDMIVNDKYEIEECTRIRATVNNFEIGDALNEITIITEKPVKVLNILIKKNNEKIFSGRADGVIIATKTGSTAYALSAGGPIIDPELDVFVLVPLCPLKIYQKPIILPSTTKLSIHILEDGADALIVADGQIRRRAPVGTIIRIEKSNKKSAFIRFSKSFYEKIRERLIKDV